MTDGMEVYAQSLKDRDDMMTGEQKMPVASSECPVCGVSTPHPHSNEELAQAIFRLKIHSESLQYEVDQYTRGEREHLLRFKNIVKDLLAWYDNGLRTAQELDRIRDRAADLFGGK